MTLRPHLAATVTAIVVFLAVLIPLFGVFDGIGWWFRLASAIALSAILTVAVETRRPERAFPVLSLATTAGAILWTLIVIQGSEFASSPFGSAVWSQVGSGVFSGWSELLRANEPTADLQAAETLLGVLLWCAVAAGLHVAARYRSPLGVLAVSAAVLWVTAAAALTSDAGGILAGAAAGVAGLLCVAAVARTDQDLWRPARLAGLIATATAAGLIGALVVSITGSLQRDPVDPRQARDTTTQIVEVPDLLAEFGARRDDSSTAFEVTWVLGDPATPLRFRLQTFGAHDGRRFLPLAEYVEVARLTQPEGQLFGDQFAVDVTIGSLDQPFIPVLDRMVRTNLTGLGWDAATQTASHSARPTTYQVTGGVIDSDAITATNIDRVGVDEAYLVVPDGIPADFRSSALTTVAGMPNDRAAVEAIVAFVDGLGRDATVASGHSLGRLQDDLTNRRAGSGEQRAALQTMLLRSAGIPARVVVGYVAVEPLVTGGSLQAWVEVPYTGVGWVPTEPTSSFAVTTVAGDPTVSTTTVPRNDDVAAQAQPRELGPGTDGFEPPAESDRLSLTEVGIVVAVLLLVALLVLLATRVVRRQRRRMAPTPDQRTLGAWAELVDRLRESGLRAGPATTVNDVIELTAGVDQAARPAATSLGDRASAVLHGPWDTTPEESDGAWDDLRTIESILREQRGVLFGMRRAIDPRVLRQRGPVPPADRDGGHRSIVDYVEQ
ncbi:MAG: transglutaminaseTgpA domain-containing protein [Actinomycetota bacterium]